MRKKTHERQLSTNAPDELTEKELGQVTGGDNKVADKASLLRQRPTGAHFTDAMLTVT
jgi:hypothetical protein